MGLRWKLLLMVLPLFVLLAVGGASLMRYSQYQEVLWGLREESRALTVGTAAFLSGDELVRVARGTLSCDDFLQRYKNAFDKLWGFGKIKGLKIFDARGERVLVEYPPATTQNSETLTKQQVGDVFQASYVISDLSFQKGSTEAPMLHGYALINDKSGRPSGIVKVESDASVLLIEQARIWKMAQYLFAAAVFAALLVVQVIGRVFGQKLRSLEGGAKALNSGKTNPALEKGILHELNQLGTVLNTLADTIDDSSARRKRRARDSETYRSDADMAAFLNERFSAPCSILRNHVEVGCRLIDAHRLGSFVLSRETSAGSMVCVGSIDTAKSTCVRANTCLAQTLVRDLYQVGQIENVFSQVQNIVPLKEFLAVEIMDVGGAVRIWRFETGSITIKEEILSSLKGTAMLLCTDPTSVAPDALRLLKLFPEEALIELINRLDFTLKKGVGGGLVILREASMHAVLGSAPNNL